MAEEKAPFYEISIEFGAAVNDDDTTILLVKERCEDRVGTSIQRDEKDILRAGR